MERKYFIGAFIFILGLFTGFVNLATGCKKTDSPFGLYAPGGLDVPSPTPLPLTGAIVVNLSDGNVLVSGATVVAVAPGGATSLTTTTNGEGQASFNPDPIAQGVWTIDVPQQTVASVQYDLSQQYVTVAGSFTNANLNFSTGAFNVSFLPLNGTTYPTTLQNNLPFNVDVAYTGSLNIPVSLSFLGNIYPLTGGPLILDASVTQASVTFQVPACSISKPAIYAQVTRTNSASIGWFSSPITIERGYPVSLTTVTVAHSPACEVVSTRSGTTNVGKAINDTWAVNEVGECPGHPFHVHVNFSPVPSFNNNGVTYTSFEDFNVSAGTPFTYAWYPTTTSPVTYSWTFTDQINNANTWSGTFVFDPHYGSGGSCNCGNGGYTGCGTNTLSGAVSTLLVP